MMEEVGEHPLLYRRRERTRETERETERQRERERRQNEIHSKNRQVIKNHGDE